MQIEDKFGIDLPDNTSGVTIHTIGDLKFYVNYLGSLKSVYYKQPVSKVCLIKISGKTTNEYRKTAMHELGHVLGWYGHSSNPNDVMYRYSSSVTQLSQRDRYQLAQIYYLVNY